MSDTPMSEPTDRRRFAGSNRAMVAIAAAFVALGGGAGAIAMHAGQPTVTMAPAVPVAIHSLTSGTIVTVKGRVAEIYGNKFIMADTSGRALVDTGPHGERALVTVGEDVTVQGRFDRGFMHASFLVGPDAKVTALEPLDGPHGGPGHHHGPRHGPDDGPGDERENGPGDGPDHGPGAPPPPPPPAAAAVAAPAK
ncbi:hypothetical protein [Novosphingobium sp.]|uniref:hypothetical protein n=1 Tax=Novosphingobium sp. TaxID=1874826 RepID=UPI003B52FFC6